MQVLKWWMGHFQGKQLRCFHFTVRVNSYRAYFLGSCSFEYTFVIFDTFWCIYWRKQKVTNSHKLSPFVIKAKQMGELSIYMYLIYDNEVFSYNSGLVSINSLYDLWALLYVFGQFPKEFFPQERRQANMKMPYCFL